MKGRLGLILMATSVVLLGWSLKAWVSSYEQWEAIRWRTRIRPGEPIQVRTIMVYSGWGSVEFAWAIDRMYLPAGSDIEAGLEHNSGKYPWHPRSTPLNAGWQREFAGFGVLRDWQLTAPAALALPAMPLVGQLFRSKPVGRWFYRWARSRRRKLKGLCVACGYDMRGGGKVCPECGNEVGEALQGSQTSK